MTNTTTAEDMITLRVPGRVAAFWDANKEELHTERDALSRDVAAAYLSGQQRAHGKNGTVWVFTTTRTLARAFLAILTAAAEAEFYSDHADTKGATAALAMIQRYADKGLTARVPEGYRMADPAAQAALDAECAKAAAEKAQDDAKAADSRAHRDAWEALTAEERTTRTGAVLDAAGTVLGYQRPEGLQWIQMGSIVISVPDGRLYMEIRSIRLAEEARPALDASREALAAAGWTVTDWGTHFYAQAPQQAEEAPAAPVRVYVDWTERRHNQRLGIMIFNLSKELDTTLTAQGREPQFRITRAANKAADGTHRYLVRDLEDTFKTTGALDHVAATAAAWLDITAPLDIQQDDETR